MKATQLKCSTISHNRFYIWIITKNFCLSYTSVYKCKIHFFWMNCMSEYFTCIVAKKQKKTTTKKKQKTNKHAVELSSLCNCFCFFCLFFFGFFVLSIYLYHLIFFRIYHQTFFSFLYPTVQKVVWIILKCTDERWANISRFSYPLEELLKTRDPRLPKFHWMHQLTYLSTSPLSVPRLCLYTCPQSCLLPSGTRKFAQILLAFCQAKVASVRGHSS